MRSLGLFEVKEGKGRVGAWIVSPLAADAVGVVAVASVEDRVAEGAVMGEHGVKSAPPTVPSYF